MSLWKIAWRSLQHRRVASLLTVLSMALGVTLVVSVLSIHGVVEKSFRGQDSFGYGIIVGAKGGKLQLTLNTVFYLSQPVENIPYDFYTEFLPAEQRNREIENSIMYHAHKAKWNAADAQALSASLAVAQGPQSLGSLLTLDALQQIDTQRLPIDKPGKFSAWTALAVPVCMGDSYKSFRVVGTTSAMFDDIVLNEDTGEGYQFAEGRNFEYWNDEHGFFEAVVGSHVARKLDIQVGDKIQPTHGVPDEEGDAHVHEEAFTVVGVLAPSGTPNDRAIFVNMEGFFLMGAMHAQSIPETEFWEEDEEHEGERDDEHEGEHEHEEHSDHSHGHDHEEHGDHDHGHDHDHDHAHDHDHDHGHQHHLDRERLPVELREVTAILVKTQTLQGFDFGYQLRTMINEGALDSSLDWSVFRPQREQKAAQAVYPVQEVTQLFDVFVKPAKWLLVAVTAMVCVVSGITILVSIYNSMNERRHEIAVMRALGAGRGTVVTVILLESVFLSLGGGVLGWLVGHGLNAIASPLFIEPNTGVAIQFWDVVPIEGVLIPALVVLAMLAGAIPAMAAYRTDVAKSLEA